MRGAFMVGKVSEAGLHWLQTHIQVPLASKPVSFLGTQAVPYTAHDQSGIWVGNNWSVHLHFHGGFGDNFVIAGIANKSYL